MTEDAIPVVLGRLARSGVSVQWRNGKAVFKAAAEPPADIIELIDARKADISAFLHPDIVQRRLEAGAEILRAPCPPDISPGRWETVIDGLRSFIARGYGAEALGLGWPRDELYVVPPLWSRVDLTGAGLLIGDREVVNITPTEIRIKTASGAEQAFRRKPAINYRVAYEAHLKVTRGNYKPDSEEAHLRAIERTVGLFRSNNPNASLEDAKRAVLVLLRP